MKAIELILSPEMVEALGWTIIHSLWQGFLILFGLTLILILIRKYSAQIKYFISFVALIGILTWSAVTYVESFRYAKEKQILKEKITASPGFVKSLLEVNLSKESETIKNQEIINFKEVKVRAFFQRNFYIICSFWLIGIVFLIVRFAGGLLYTWKLKRFNVTTLPDEWIEIIQKLTFKLNINRKIKAFFSPLAQGPMTLGILKPILLFPVSAFTGLSAKEIEAIIAHELAHVLRNDYLFNIIQSMVEIIFFYHPAVWIISSKIRKERENSCDNIAVQAIGDKVVFVKALASVQINFWENQQLAMGFAGKKNNILHRIKRLQNNIVMKTNFIEGLIAAGVIVLGLALASFTNIENIKAKNMAVVNSPDSVTTVKKEPVNPADIDSIRISMENNLQDYRKNNKSDKELEKMVEVALSDEDREHSAEMMEEINHSLEDINIDETVSEAMQEASAAVREAMIEVSKSMREASIDVSESMNEIKGQEINRDMDKAARDIEEAKREMADDMRRDMYREGVDRDVIEASIKAASAGLDVAAGVVSSIDIEGIVSSALSGVAVTLDALGDVDYDPSNLPNKNRRYSSNKRHYYDCDSSRQYERDDCDNHKRQDERMERQKERLKENKEELERRMQELEQRMDENKNE